MDGLYPRLCHAVLDPWLDAGQFAQLASLNALNNPPGPVGSAYDGGWEGYLQRALRQAVNPTIANGYSRVYCGGDRPEGRGNPGDCGTAVRPPLPGALQGLGPAHGQG